MIKPREERDIAVDPMIVCRMMFIPGAFVIEPYLNAKPTEIEFYQGGLDMSEPEYIWSKNKDYIICSWGLGHIIVYSEDKGYARLSDITPIEVMVQINENFKQLKK